MLWLLNLLYDVLSMELIHPSVWIACGDKIPLVSVTLANIHCELRRMTTALCTVTKTILRIDMHIHI